MIKVYVNREQIKLLKSGKGIGTKGKQWVIVPVPVSDQCEHSFTTYYNPLISFPVPGLGPVPLKCSLTKPLGRNYSRHNQKPKFLFANLLLILSVNPPFSATITYLSTDRAATVWLTYLQIEQRGWPHLSTDIAARLSIEAVWLTYLQI